MRYSSVYSYDHVQMSEVMQAAAADHDNGEVFVSLMALRNPTGSAEFDVEVGT